MDGASSSGGKPSLLVAAGLSILLGALCQVDLLAVIFGPGALVDGSAELAARGRSLLLASSALLAAMACSPLAKSRRLSVSVATASLMLIGFEAVGGPFVGLDTTLFQRDPEVGWRLRPGGDDVWLGHRVRINELGMRGALPDFERGQRVLFLGDSVVFGAFVADDEEVLSAQTEQALSAVGFKVQCLNGGVGGWAPWQERLWYEAVAGQLRAGVVLVHLVLNDVTEPLTLAALGGADEGFQLERSREPGWLSGTVWATALRRARRAVNGDQARVDAARQEALGVYELLRSPALPASRDAWARHLREVEELLTSIKAAGATPVVVSHPYTVQFEVPGLWWPQDALAVWCSQRGVRYVDVGRHLATLRPDPETLYHDGVHPNARGAAAIGAHLADELQLHGLVVSR